MSKLITSIIKCCFAQSEFDSSSFHLLPNPMQMDGHVASARRIENVQKKINPSDRSREILKYQGEENSANYPLFQLIIFHRQHYGEVSKQKLRPARLREVNQIPDSISYP